jgi:hypothetical protein
MATYYWQGGDNHSLTTEYAENEAYPQDFCWNIASNWLVLSRLVASDGPYIQRLLPATTPPGGGDTVIFKRFSSSEAAEYGVSHAFPRAKCGFGGYWGAGGWINAGNTLGQVRITVHPNYGYGDIWKSGTSEQTEDGVPPLTCGSPWFAEGPSSSIGFDNDAAVILDVSSSTNLRQDYIANPSGFCPGVNFPAGLTGFHNGIRVNARGFYVFNDSREYGSGIPLSGIQWGGRCRINLVDSICESLVAKTENTKIKIMGGTYDQCIIDEPTNKRAINGLQFLTMKNTDTSDDIDGELPKFTEYFYVGNFTGTGNALGGACVAAADKGRHNGFVYMNNHDSVSLTKLTVNTPYSAREYVGPAKDDYESGIRFSTSADEVEIYPQRKEEFSWVSPSGIDNSVNYPYFGHTGVIFKSLIDYDGCTIGTMNLYSNSNDSDNTRNIYTIGGEDVIAQQVNNIIGMNNLVFFDTPATINTLNLDGGRFVVGSQLNDTHELGRNVQGDLIINKGRIQEDCVLDATLPWNSHYKRFKVGAGTTHPSQGEGITILPEGGQIKLPSEQLFVSDYAASGLYVVDKNSDKFNTEFSTFPRRI